MFKIEVCLSPALYHLYEKENQVVVVIDVIRASASICTALHWGATKIYPVTNPDEALLAGKNGHLISGERYSKKLEGFDFGNSPFEFQSTKIKGKELTMTTTNGTHSICVAKNAEQVIIGSFLNFDYMLKYLIDQEKDILLLCSGWQQKVNIEDSLFAGKIAQAILTSKKITTSSDSVSLAIDIYKAAKDNLFEYIINASPRLKSKLYFLEKDIRYCLYGKQMDVLPVLQGEYLMKTGN